MSDLSEPRPTSAAIGRESRGPDRRARPAGVWDFLTTPARRSGHRRDRDQGEKLGIIRFVDRHPRSVGLMAVALLIFTLTDGVLTLLLVKSHCAEVNPFMNQMLRRGDLHFLLSKYILTALGVAFLIGIRTYPMFGSRFRVEHLLPILVGLYVVLLAYQWTLLVRGPDPGRPGRARPVHRLQNTRRVALVRHDHESVFTMPMSDD